MSQACFLILCISLIRATFSPTFASDIDRHDDQIPEGTAPILVISNDGGGIRGLYSLTIAKAVQHQIGGGVELYQQASCLAGTSTGGIIALAAAKGIPLSDIIDIYEFRGEQIFKKRSGLWGCIQSLFNEKYSASGLEALLQEALEDSTLGSLDQHVVIPTYDLQGGIKYEPSTSSNDEKGFSDEEYSTPGNAKPFIFTTTNEALSTVPLWQAARATTAAPTYFEPFYGLEGYSLIDGGVFANHPGHIAIADIVKSVPEAQKNNTYQSIHMLSFGTGGFSQPVPRWASKNRGLLQWGVPISQLMMTGTSQNTDQTLRSLLEDRYIRLGGKLEQKIKLDGITPDEITALIDSAEAYVQSNPDIIDRAAKMAMRAGRTSKIVRFAE